MKNRKQPFGYRVEMGAIVLHPQEATLVEYIFQQYLSGASYKQLVTVLREQPIPYDEGKLWNKNMVARILADHRYTGEGGYGKKYCHNSPTLDEAPLQRAILAAINSAMSNKDHLIRQLQSAMELELAPMPGDHTSLADIEQRLQKLGEQVREIVAKAAATKEVQVHAPLLKEIADEMDALKKKRALIEIQRQTHEHAFRRIEIATDAMDQVPAHITEWDESLIRQLVDTIKVHSAEKITVYLRGGVQIEQTIRKE